MSPGIFQTTLWDLASMVFSTKNCESEQNIDGVYRCFYSCVPEHCVVIAGSDAGLALREIHLTATG